MYSVAIVARIDTFFKVRKDSLMICNWYDTNNLCLSRNGICEIRLLFRRVWDFTITFFVQLTCSLFFISLFERQEVSKCVDACNLIFLVIRRGAVAVYPFTSASKNRDVSSYVNPPATFVGMYYTRGPDNHPQGALSFRGSKTSYVLIPNNGCLDTRYSLTIIMWVYPESSGPILHFNPKGWGLHLWIINRFRLFARFVPRSGKSVKALYKRIKPRQWNYIAATYDRRTGLASLWLDSLPIIQRRLGRFRSGLATNYPIVIGSKPGDRRKFRGKIACVQMYNYAMNGQQIRSKKKQCFRQGLCCNCPRIC